MGCVQVSVIETPFLKLDRVDRTREVFRLARQNKTANEIAADLGVDSGIIRKLASEEGITLASTQRRIWPGKEEPGIGYADARDPWDRSPYQRAFHQWAQATKAARAQRQAVGAAPPVRPVLPPPPIEVRHGAPINLLTTGQARTILQLVALKRLVTVDEVIGPRRDRQIVAVRHEAIRLVHQHCPHLSLPMIGRLFGNRDHTTILHSLKKRKVKSTSTFPRNPQDFHLQSPSVEDFRGFQRQSSVV